MEKININSPCWYWQINTLTMSCKNYVWCHNMKFHKIPYRYLPHRRFFLCNPSPQEIPVSLHTFLLKVWVLRPTPPPPPQECPMTFQVRRIDTFWKHTINAEINYLLTVHLLDNNFFPAKIHTHPMEGHGKFLGGGGGGFKS